MTSPTILPGYAADAASGPAHLLRGYRLLLLPGVRGIMLVPLLGNMLLFVLAAALALYGVESALDRWLPAALDWLRWLLYPLALVLVLLLAFISFILVGNLLLAPFHGLLAERVERALTGRTLSAPIRFGWAFIRRTVSQEARRLAYVLALLLGVFVLGFIPVLGLLAVPLGLVLGAWLLAFEFAANPMGNWGWDVAQQRAFLRARRIGFLGFGFSAMGLSLVPLLNLALLPAAVAGMTAYCIHLRDAQPAAGAPDATVG